MRLIFSINSACSGGPEDSWMGVGIVAQAGQYHREWSLSLGLGTTGRAQLLSVIEALKKIEADVRSQADVEIETPSKYVVGVFQRGWNAKANLDLVEEARTLINQFKSVSFLLCEKFDGNANLVRAQSLAEDAAIEIKVEQPALFSMTMEEEAVKVEGLLHEVLRRIRYHQIPSEMFPDDLVDDVMNYFIGSQSVEDLEEIPLPSLV